MAHRPDGITVAKLAEKLGASRTKVYHLIEAGWLEVFPGPGVKLVTLESVDRFYEAARTGHRAS